MSAIKVVKEEWGRKTEHQKIFSHIQD